MIMSDETAAGSAGACTRVTLRPLASAPRSVRRIVREICTAAALPQQVIDDATLVASELVSDRLKQARWRLDVTVEAAGQSVTIRVCDQGETPAYSRAARVGSRRSREIVHHLASSWGYADGAHGWAAWASLRAPVA